MQPQGDTIWGNINQCVEIALNIYYLWGEHGEGIVIPREYAEANFTEKTIAAGKESDGNLYYEKGDTMDIPMYEMLRKRAAMARKMELAAATQMESIRRNGQTEDLEIWKNMEPPEQEAGPEKIREGVYLLDGKEPQIAIHEQIAVHFLSPYACEFGEDREGYFYYNLQAGAIPLNELKEVYPECRQLILSEESLYATICRYYPVYRERFNEIAGKEEQIPDIQAPVNLFLREQLDREQNAEIEEESALEIQKETKKYDEDEYGEQVNYGMEW